MDDDEMPESDSSIFTFEKFAAGSELGRVDVPLDETRRALWVDIFGSSINQSDTLPQGILVSAMMQGSLRALGPRPGGNIHASQSLEFIGGRPKLGDVATVRMHVVSKESKRERKWVTLGADVSIDGDIALNLLVSTCDLLKPQFESRTVYIRFTAPCPRGEKLSAKMVLIDPATGIYDVWVTRSDGVRVIEGTAELGAPQEGAPIDATLIPTDRNTKNASNQ